MGLQLHLYLPLRSTISILDINTKYLAHTKCSMKCRAEARTTCLPGVSRVPGTLPLSKGLTSAADDSIHYPKTDGTDLRPSSSNEVANLALVTCSSGLGTSTTHWEPTAIIAPLSKALEGVLTDVYYGMSAGCTCSFPCQCGSVFSSYNVTTMSHCQLCMGQWHSSSVPRMQGGAGFVGIASA